MRLKLVKKFRDKKARIAIVGLGHVGLPTAVVFAREGYQVIGVDIRSDVVQAILAGKIRTREPGLEELLRKVVKSGRLTASKKTLDAVKECDVVIVCVQTPLDNQRKPNLTYLKNACKDVAQGLSEGKLVIIESSVPPMTMKNIVLEILESESGLECGVDFWLTYCPERVAPGKILQEFVKENRIVGSFDDVSAKLAAELLKAITKGNVSPTDCRSAEVAKLAENAFRDVNIAFANELALVCEQVGVNVMEVVRLANTHSRVHIHMPGPGVGGPCLTKDPHLLLYPVRAKGFKSKIIEASRDLNDHMKKHMVELVVEALQEVGKVVGGAKITLLGVAYKAETSDSTNSPAETIIRQLIKLGAKVVVFDPYSKKSFGGHGAKNLKDAAVGSDCLLVVTDHLVFRELDLDLLRKLMGEKPVIVDGRHAIDPDKAVDKGFFYQGIGYPRSRCRS